MDLDQFGPGAILWQPWVERERIAALRNGWSALVRT